MNSTANIHQLAGIAYNAFQTIERVDDAGRTGDTISTLKDDAPEWVRGLVREAHGDMFPDDWRYDAIRSALEEIHDNRDVDDLADLDEIGTEWVDGYVDVYTGARLKWLASNLNRAGYCDEAVSEGLASDDADIVERIGLGQYMEAREVWGLVVTALDRAAEHEDESEES